MFELKQIESHRCSTKAGISANLINKYIDSVGYHKQNFLELFDALF